MILRKIVGVGVIILLSVVISFAINNFQANASDRDDCDNLYASGQYTSAAECYLSLDPPDYWKGSD